jgi:sterol desaturase/sphingolipid hydroxylase (fatty acid hydroxylase superfamily)
MELTQLTSTVAVCTAILALINFPFVIGVERYIATHSVKFVYAIAAPEGQKAREFRNALTTTPVHALLFVSFIFSGWLAIGEETISRIIFTFVGTLIWTEIWHYFSHRAMHLRMFIFLHREHHLSRVTGVWSSVSFSFLEKFAFSVGILGGLAIVSQSYPVSAIGITLYYVFYFFTNTLGHANFEFRKPDYRSSIMGKIFNSPTYHAMHHARYTSNYGLLTPWLDQIFGTEWKDSSKVQTRAAMGHPLTKLSERL